MTNTSTPIAVFHKTLPPPHRRKMFTGGHCTIFLCVNDNMTLDTKINIAPVSESEFAISYIEPKTIAKCWTCDASALFQYINTVFASLLADASDNQVAKIQISTPLFPSFMMKTFVSPKNIETIRDILLKQLALFIRTEADGRGTISWPRSSNAGMSYTEN